VSTRARLAAVAAILSLSVIGLAMIALNWPSRSLGERPARTWVVQPGETLRLSADRVHPDDEYGCPGKPGLVIGTPEPGSGASASGGIQVTTDLAGTVAVTC